MNNIKKIIGQYIFMAGIFAILMLNLNTYEMYQRVVNYNGIITAAVLTAVLLCCVDLKPLWWDKMFIAVVVTDVITAVNMILSHTGFTTFFTVYSVTMALYLADKVVLKNWQTIAVVGFVALFFFYWTFDVKGYFKGYSINFGGVVLISGFVFVIILLEILKYKILNTTTTNNNVDSSNHEHNTSLVGTFLCFIKKYPYYITFLEAFMFIWAYNIISWYKSRTALMALIVFAILLCIPKKVMCNKVVSTILTVAVTCGMVIFPYIYIKIANSGLLADKSVFYKPLIGDRATIYDFLIEMVKQFPLRGNGTIFVMNGAPFRDGLLDTCNGFLQIAVPNGMVVAVLVMGLLIATLIKMAGRLRENRIATTVFSAICALFVASYSESGVFNPVFIIVISAALIVCNSMMADKSAEVDDTMDVYCKLFKESALRKRLIPALCVTVMVLVMYLILGPLEIYYSNYTEFMFNTSDFILIFIGISVAAAIAIPLIIASLPDIVSVVYCVIGFAFGIGSYIQYMFINGDLVDNEGNFVLDLDIGARYYVSIAVFAGLLILTAVLAVMIKDRMRPVFTYGSLFITAIMMTAVVSIAVGLIGYENKETDVLAFNTEEEFTFSPDENVIVLILDTFGREAFYEELAADEHAFDLFHDFTFYKNHDSVYSPTFPSLTHLLTEYEYDGQNSTDYFEAAFTSESSRNFYNALHDNGYYVGIYSIDVHPKDYMLGLTDSIVPCKISVNYRVTCSRLLTLSMYRYVPYNVKRLFQVHNPWVGTVSYSIQEPVLYNETFLRRLRDNGMAVSDVYGKKFNLSHVTGFHAPVCNDEFCNRVPDGSVSRHQRAQGVILLTREYLDGLKALGVYDNSTIIVMGDHGENGNTDSVFLIKGKGESHDAMEVSEEMVTHCEFQSIVLEAVSE